MTALRHSVCSLALGLCWAVAAFADPGDAGIDFRRDVYPLLQARCFECHQGADPSAGYRLDDRGELLGETTGIPLVVVGDSQGSRLIELVEGRDRQLQMPPEGPRLSPEEIDRLRRWIDQGLAWDAKLLPPSAKETDHWAFQPIKRPRVPPVADSGPAANPIDAFIARAQRRVGLAAAPLAERRVLLRRLSFDLLGLPPTSREQAAFLSDTRPDAWERVVERMLCAPQYGERWGRHWLDVARWAETEGYESNHPRQSAWRYREYVVDSFNEDRPYDEFVRQQIAGDELEPYRDENLIATGFLAAARISSNEEDRAKQRNDVLVDVVNTVGDALLGLTLGCAQCHSHKFDPITIRDYYRLQGYFVQGHPGGYALQDSENRREYEARKPADYEPARRLKQALYEKGRREATREAMESLDPAMRAALAAPARERTPEQAQLARRAELKFAFGRSVIERAIPDEDRNLYAELKRKIAKIEETLVEPQTFAFYSPASSPHSLELLPPLGFYPLVYDPGRLEEAEPYLKLRGSVHQHGPKLEAGWPAVFDAACDVRVDEPLRGSRRELAAWLTDPGHPLTARVWVNRVWHYHFGRGLVATPGDFGLAGAAPSHPQLLDWLASELIESGWSTKHIHRLILTSLAYRRSAHPEAGQRKRDPDNVHVSYWRPRRLEAEPLRDALLAVSGELDQRLGGASVPLDERESSPRRSLYLYQKRGLAPQVQTLFDGPIEMAESCSARHTSTTALQSLYLLNNEFVLARAMHLAETVRRLAGDDRERQIEHAVRRVLGRPPAEAEREAGLEFLAEQTDRPLALALFCQALLNLNEFVYLE